MVRLGPRYGSGRLSLRATSSRVEVRTVDCAANPYLAIAVMLGAGLKGIEDGLELPAPVTVNVFDLTPAQREERGLEPLPTNLAWAIDRFASSQLMREILGEDVFSYLIKSKRAEWESYRSHVTSWEIDRYLAKL